MKSLLIVGVLLLVGCPGDGLESRGLDEPFEVGYGNAVRVDEGSLNLAFNAVNEDSRCPTGVQCPWAGRATITVVASNEGSPHESLRLTIPSPDTVTYRSYTIALLQLAPYPSIEHATRRGEYVATLVVKRP